MSLSSFKQKQRGKIDFWPSGTGLRPFKSVPLLLFIKKSYRRFIFLLQSTSNKNSKWSQPEYIMFNTTFTSEYRIYRVLGEANLNAWRVNSAPSPLPEVHNKIACNYFSLTFIYLLCFTFHNLKFFFMPSSSIYKYNSIFWDLKYSVTIFTQFSQ